MTVTRRGLWLSQLLHPEVSHVVAFGLSLRGRLDADRLLHTAGAVLDHVGWCDVRLSPDRSPADGHPHPLQPADSGLDPVECVDLSACADPAAESESRAQRFLDDPAGADLGLPLFRSELHALAPDSHRWIVRVHHVLTDGAGVLRVMAHIAAVYAGTARPDEMPLADDLELEAEEEKYRDSRRRGTDEQHWARRLDGLEPSLLAGSVPLTSSITRVTETLTSPRTASSAEFVAAFSGLCARFLDTPDVVLSLPVAARTSAARLRAVQPVSNVVPLRLDGIGDRDAGQALAEVSTALVDALRHQRFPREDMLRNRNAINGFGAVVNLLPGFDPPAVDGLHWGLEVMRTGPISDVAVTLHPADQNGRRAVTWEAPAAVVDTDALATLARRFDRHLTATLIELDGGPRIPDDSVFVDGEWERFRCRSGPPAPPFTPTVSHLEDHWSSDPDAVAIIDGEVSVSRREFARRVDRGTRLLVEAGVGAGDRVAVSIERSVTSVVAFWSVLCAGGVWVPVGDPFAPEARTRDLLDRSGAKVGLCVPGTPRPGSIRWLDLEHDAPEHDAPEPDDPGSPVADRRPGLERGPDDAAYLLFTSGSTGTPKGVVMPHRGLPALIAEIQQTYALAPGSRILHASSPTFDTGIVEMLCGVVCGATVVVAPRSAPGGDALAHLIRRHRVSHLIVTPSVLDTLPVDLADDLVQVIIGGEPPSPRVVDRWSGRVRLRNAYGPTETRCSINISAPLSPGGAITVGPPMVGVDEAVLDRLGRPQPPGALGTLHCAGPQLADGYLDDPASTAEAFVQSTFSADAVMYRTGDLAEWTEDGEIRLLGRRDGQITLRGLRIELAEIDAALGRCTGVRSCATILRELPSGRTALVSFVVPQGTGTDVDAPGLRRAVAEVLPSYMVPALIVGIDALPRTGNGKLDVGKLADHPLPGRRSVRGPVGSHETLLVRVVGEALGTDEVDLFAGFLEQGGDSLAVMRVVGLLTAAGHSEIGPDDVLTAPDLEALAERMVEPVRPGTTVRRPTAPDDDRPLTSAERTVERAPGHAHGQLVRVGWVPPEAGRPTATELRELLCALVDRHPALRSIYPDTPCGPVQRALAGGADAAVSVAVQVVSDRDLNPGREMLRAHAEHMSASLDVRVAPPFCVRILSDADGGVVAAVAVFHHIAVDGHSLGTLAREADLIARGVDVPVLHSISPPAQHADDDVDGRSWQKLLGMPPAEAFTLDGLDPVSCAQSTAIRRRALVDADVYTRFHAEASEQGMTPFEAFGRSVSEALARLTGQDRMMAATAASQRPAGADDTVGDFVISAMTPLDAREDARDSVARTRRCIAAANAPMEDVLDALGRPVVDGRLFPVPVLLGWTPTIIRPSAGGHLYVFPPPITRWMLQVEGSPTAQGELQVLVTGAASALEESRVEQVLAEVIACVRRV
ncbi:amino acid adenylation domain-containing protein [Gordonia sp. 'Campus']|uniref:non-ribosomal peptide synthetase n=1 Tax=Gordonia sp. 'Campus' TaxID=2915824 RepID=UPI001EE3D1DD|nr:amino acid adenylation domain-containing protein [Gordonia sp. 'Campus']